MINFKISVEGVPATDHGLTRIQRVVADAAILGINKTAYHVWDGLRSEMSRAFDRPTPYVLNSLQVLKATRVKPWAEIGPQDFVGKGTKPKHILTPQIMGGPRNAKRSEVALQRAKILPSGMYTVPGRGADKDGYGNMSRGQIVQIISYFNAFGEQGYRANMGDKGKVRLAKGSKRKGTHGISYFAVRSKRSHLAQGIYKRTQFGKWGTAISPMVMFIKEPTYRKRYRFYEVATAITHASMHPDFISALKESGAAD